MVQENKIFILDLIARGKNNSRLPLLFNKFWKLKKEPFFSSETQNDGF